MDRKIFCAYWLYFYGFRGVFGRNRVLDYIGMSLAVLGLMHLIYTNRLHPKLVGWVILFLSPFAVAAFLNPSAYIILYVIKMSVVALYFAGYFKAMRLTLVEFVCFAIPVVLNVYFFIDPRPSAEMDLLKGRLSGISGPNFTSLSLIYAMCGVFGVYVLKKVRRARAAAIVTVLICFLGVLLTASRAGFIGATIAICLFLVSQKKIRYASVAVVVAFTITGNWSSVGNSLNGLVVVQRFQKFTDKPDPLMQIISERSFTEKAWNDIRHGKWFIGGGPQEVAKWAEYIRVPHNSLLDIGLGFGKASFYFYGALLLVLLFVNLMVIVANWRCRTYEEKTRMLAAMLFFSLLPMYMSLSAGLTMSFILWLVLGAYPLLHASPKLAKVLSKNCIYRHIKV